MPIQKYLLPPAGSFILDAMERKRMTRKDLAEKTFYDSSMISKYIMGDVHMTGKAIVRISLILGLDPVTLGRLQSDYEVTLAVKAAMNINK